MVMNWTVGPKKIHNHYITSALYIALENLREEEPLALLRYVLRNDLLLFVRDAQLEVLLR